MAPAVCSAQEVMYQAYFDLSPCTDCSAKCRQGKTAEERRIVKRILAKCAYRELNWLDAVIVMLTSAYPGT